MTQLIAQRSRRPSLLNGAATLSSHASGRTHVAIIGAGISGCLSALELARAGFKVTLIEQRHEVLAGTSNITPGRMGLGFHYLHEPTGLLYLESTVAFTREFLATCPGLRVGEHAPASHYLKRGRYFLVRDSACNQSELLQAYASYQQRYRELVARDRRNQVFGPPEQFDRVLGPDEYHADVDRDRVVCGVETCEQLLHWPRFRAHLARTLAQTDAIELLTGTRVEGVRYDLERLEYRLMLRQHDGASAEVRAPYVVNAAWEHAESLTTQAAQGSRSRSQPHLVDGGEFAPVRTNRLKALAHVVLPAALRCRPSMFFCMGPYAMFSNLGDGTGLISYAPVTNVAASTALVPPAEFDRLTQHGATPEEKAYYGHGIIAGVAQFIPAMAKARLKDVRFGVVKTKGEVDIYDPASEVNRRDYTGVVERGIGWVENACMKLLFGHANAHQVVEIISRQRACRNAVEALIERILVPQIGAGASTDALKARILRTLPFVEYTSEPAGMQTLCPLAQQAATDAVASEGLDAPCAA